MKIAFQANSVPIQFVEPEIYYRNKIHAFLMSLTSLSLEGSGRHLPIDTTNRS